MSATPPGPASTATARWYRPTKRERLAFADVTKGADGSQWFGAAGAPGNGDHAIGDWYLNVTSGQVYQKTGESSWTSRGNIKGATGAAGAAGADGYLGNFATGARPAAAGNTGKWYYDTTVHKPGWSDNTTWNDSAGVEITSA
jgi:hypothetical protein